MISPDWDNEEDRFISEKFDECFSCRNRFNIHICSQCDVGEYFDSDDVDELDESGFYDN